DGVQAAVMACEMAEYWKNKGKTLLDALHELYKQHGFYKEGLDALTLEGKSGQEKIGMNVNNFRSNKREEIGNMETLYVEDYLERKRTYKIAPKKIEKIDLPQENVVKYVLEDNCWVCLRPSGTEPKVKWYYGAYGE